MKNIETENSIADGILHFVIYDHDGVTSDIPSSDSEKTYLICKNNDMLHRSHRLKRKTQENYIPVDALREIVSIKQKLSDTQKEETNKNIELYESKGDKRFFENVVKLSPNNGQLFKNAFSNESHKNIWMKNEWFDEDGSRLEMIKLAESIMSCM